MKSWVLSGLPESGETPGQGTLLCIGKDIRKPASDKEFVLEAASPLHQDPVPPVLAKVTSLTQVSSSLLWSNNMRLERLLLKFWCAENAKDMNNNHP